MRPRLPLTQLRTFEAAVRLGSFAAAAHELGLTPSAVSHGIRELEHVVRVPLFVRSPRRIDVTPAGQALYAHVMRGIDELQQGIDTVGTSGPASLRVHCAPSFATQWLLPRLGEFLRDNPGLELKVSADADFPLFPTDEYDLDVYYGEPRQTGVEGVPLATETLCPLCSPQLAARIKTVADLRAVTLIQSDNNLVRWPQWFAVNGEPPPPTAGPRFDRSHMSIAAAAYGVGVALESVLLAERELKTGQLVAPLSGRADDVQFNAHRLIWTHGAERQFAFRRFVDWFLQQLALRAIDWSHPPHGAVRTA